MKWLSYFITRRVPYNAIGQTALKRLRHYFTIEYDRPEKEVTEQFSMASCSKTFDEHGGVYSSRRTVFFTGLYVYEIYGGCKHIKKMKTSFSANYPFREDDVSIHYDSPNVIARASGKTIKQAGNEFFDAITRENEFIFTPTGYNGVSLDYKAKIHVHTFPDAGFSYSHIILRLEFLK